MSWEKKNKWKTENFKTIIKGQVIYDFTLSNFQFLLNNIEEKTAYKICYKIIYFILSWPENLNLESKITTFMKVPLSDIAWIAYTLNQTRYMCTKFFLNLFFK